MLTRTIAVALLLVGRAAMAAECADYSLQLRTMREADEGIRALWPAEMASEDFGNSRTVRMTEAIDRQNTARLKSLIDKCGWPRREDVGSDGLSAAWLIVQHADDDVAFQSTVLKTVKRAHARGDAESDKLALLEDRVAIAHNKPQVYGTQFKVVPPCGLEPLPMRDARNVDARRAALGLGPLEDYRKQVAEVALPETCRAPKDTRSAP